MGIGAILGELANYTNATNSDPQRAVLGRYGMAQQDEREAASAQLTNSAKQSILKATIDTIMDPRTPPENIPMLQDNAMKLGASMGIDPSVFGNIEALRQPAQPDLKAVGGSIVSIDPTTGEVTEKYRAPDRNQNRLTRLRPGDIAVGADGEPVAQNKNQQFAPPRPVGQTRTGFRQGVQSKTQEALSAEEAKDDGTLAQRLKIAHRKIDARLGDTLIGVGEAKGLRDNINKSALALKTFDQQYAKAAAILDKNPDIATIGGDAAKIFRGLTVNALGLIGTLAPNFAGMGEGVSVAFDDWQDKLEEVAGSNRELQTILFSIAMQSAVAKGLDKGGFSNKEIERSIRDVGGDIRNASGIKRKMKEVRAQLRQALGNQLDLTLENYETISDEDPVQEKQTESIEDRMKRYSRGKP